MQPTTSAEKELLKENLYRNRVQDLLRKHRGVLQAGCLPGNGSEDPALLERQYAAERSVIKRVMANETSAFLSGIALSGLVFASVRYGPRRLAILINPDKERLLREADDIARKANTRWIQKTTALLFETSFGLWAGWRGYNIVSSQNASSYDEIAKLPLCSGRSSVAERVCPDWIDLVHAEIPPPFWSNLEEGAERSLREPQRWRAVREFAGNCIKRQVFEDSYRRQRGWSAGTAVHVPEGGVPEDILVSLSREKDTRINK